MATTLSGLVREINARNRYTYFSTPTQRIRVVSARTRKNAQGDREFQVRELGGEGKWISCCPSEISVEG